MFVQFNRTKLLTCIFDRKYVESMDIFVLHLYYVPDSKVCLVHVQNNLGKILT